MGRCSSGAIVMGGNQVSTQRPGPPLGGLFSQEQRRWKPGFHAVSSSLPDSPQLCLSKKVLSCERVVELETTSEEMRRSPRSRTLVLAGVSIARAPFEIPTRLVSGFRRIMVSPVQWKPGFHDEAARVRRSGAVRDGRVPSTRKHCGPVVLAGFQFRNRVTPKRLDRRQDRSGLKLDVVGDLSSFRREKHGQHP